MSTTADWLDEIALHILTVEAELRSAVRDLTHHRPARAYRSIALDARAATLTISRYTARTILHGMVPAAIAVTPLRRQHARLVAALNLVAGHLVGHNDPIRPPGPTLWALEALIAEARAYHREAAWRVATIQAGVKGWRCPQPAISVVMRQPTPTLAEQTVHMPAAGDAHRRHLATGEGWIEQRRQQQALQLALPLPPPRPAEVTDLRQHALSLVA